MKHALVVGGTGMLQNVSLWLLENGYHVSVIARNPRRMENLLTKTSRKRHVTPLLVDYANNHELQNKLKNTIQQNGSIDIVVAWIHSYAKEALSTITAEISRNQNEYELFHVLGSATKLEAIKKKAAVPDNCLYYQVRLGFVLDGTYSRWLTNQEISSGVIEAIQEKKDVFTIGVVEPWEKRP